MANKDLALKFNMEDWIEILPNLNLKQVTISEDLSKESKKHFNEVNKDRQDILEFYQKLKANKEANKELIREAYVNSKPFPFPALINLPKTKTSRIPKAIIQFINKVENKELYYALLKNNKRPAYQELVWRMSPERRRDSVFFETNYEKHEFEFFRIFQSAIAMGNPHEVQNAFEYFIEEYSKLDKIDSKKELEEKTNEMLSSFHKAMRQTDMFGNGHSDSIVYNLWCVTDIPIRVFTTVANHIKKQTTEKV